jgi:hypothetical protein
MDFPPSKSICPAPYKKTGTLVILWTGGLWTRYFRAYSEMVSNKFWMAEEGGESEGEQYVINS